MDGPRFDGLTRAFARGTTRRGVVAVVVGLAAIAADGGVASAARRSTCRPLSGGCTRGSQCCSGYCDTRRQTPRKRRNRCACAVGDSRCGDACVDLDTDASHCGACGVACVGAEVCIDGGCTCAEACTDDEVCCEGTCADLDTDANHCGACGRVCKDDSPCTTGVCDYREACAAVFDSDWDQCAFDVEGNLYAQDHRMYLKAGSAGFICEQNSQCQELPICGIETNSCWCYGGEVWSTSADDGYVLADTQCFASFRESACSDPDVASNFPYCYTDVEGTAWGAHRGAYQRLTAINIGCTSSAECQLLDARCDDAGYRCGCAYSYRDNSGDLLDFYIPACIIDNILPV